MWTNCDALVDLSRNLSTNLPSVSRAQRTGTGRSAYPLFQKSSQSERLLAEILVDPRAALGQTACWPLGDIIITLQVPADTLLWTRDPDFSALAAALGIRLYTTNKFLGS